MVLEHCFILITLFYVVCISYASTSQRGSSPFNCNFDRRTLCGWSNTYRHESVDDFNWKWGSGSDGKNKGSGTRYDHTGGGGYVFIKSKSKENRTARLISPRITLLRASACFQFWYFMRGRDMGHIEVLLANSRTQPTSEAKTLWNLRGHQGNIWKQAQIPLPVSTRGYLEIEAFDWKKGRNGNILLDDFSVRLVSRGTCNDIRPPYAAPTLKNSDVTTSPRSSTTPRQSTAVSATELMTTASVYQASYDVSSIAVKTKLATVVDNESATTMFVKNMATDVSEVSKPTTSTVKTRIINETAITTLSITTKKSNRMLTTAGYKSKFQMITSKHMEATENQNQTVLVYGKAPQSVDDFKIVVVAVVVGIVGFILIVGVGLTVYLRKRKKQRSLYADDCSVIMTRMYPDITSEPKIDYTKLT